MGDASGASGLSLASTGFKMYGEYLSSRGTAAADTYQSEVLDQAAQYGELKAKQTNAQLTRNLTMTLGNIDAVRAAARTDPTSPTGVAVRDFVESTGTEQKNIKVENIMEQAQMDEANAAYLRSASSAALLSGDIAMAGTALGGLSGAIPSGNLGNSSIGNPTQIGALY